MTPVRQVAPKWASVLPMEAKETPARFDDIRREELARMFKQLLRTRQYLQPVFVIVLGYVIIADPAHWRGLVVGVMTLLAIVLTRAESRRVAGLGIAQFTPARREAYALFLVVPITSLVTGGLHSPWLVSFIPSAALVAISHDRRTTTILLAAMICVVWCFALLERHGPWMMPALFLDAGGHTNTTFTVCSAVFFTAIAIYTAAVGVNIRSMSDAMLLRSLEARDEMLKLHAERLNDLTTLSGEIAHELKNPLASIKGLAQLVEVDPSRASERLHVLRGEVDRMRTILDEFLNFSRPLVPLSRGQVDLADLARSVAELHEGVAGERRLTLVSPSDDRVVISCDPRKVKQILINLLQNAIDASGTGAEIRIAVDRRGTHAAVRILDRGHGLAPEMRARAFEAGFTSKARGSGLGLTVSRMLAEQHGGSITLSDREGGGCVAEFLLPSGEPVAVEGPNAGTQPRADIRS